jgi:hypothetical protein
MAFPDDFVVGSSAESTTRGRSFLFFALGIFGGSGLEGGFTLMAPENGLIALNVPLDPLRLGALSTRTTHPFYIARWNELLSLLAVPGRIDNPYWNLTKGEMTSACADQALLRRLAPLSLSCSSPSKGRWQDLGTQHCGYCLPCLIRRAALNAGFGRGADPTVYTLANMNARPLDTRQSEGQQVRSFQLAIERLRLRPDLAKILIHKPGQDYRANGGSAGGKKAGEEAAQSSGSLQLHTARIMPIAGRPFHRSAVFNRRTWCRFRRSGESPAGRWRKSNGSFASWKACAKCCATRANASAGRSPVTPA